MSSIPNYALVKRDSYENTSQSSPIRRDLNGSARRAKPGIGWSTPLSIIVGTVLCAVIAVGHHLFDAHLNDRSVTGYWTQSKSHQVEIFLATAFKIIFCFSAGVSLVQVTWHSMRRQPLLLGDINALLSGPSITTFLRINLLRQAPGILAIVFALLVSSLITIFAPSLTVRQAVNITRTLSVPTLDLNTDAVLNDFSVDHDRYGPITSSWDKAALQGLLAENPVGWTIPDGCDPECEYNITYTAPALQCIELQPDQIDDELTDANRDVSRVFQNPPAAYLWAYDALLGDGSAMLNFTTQDRYANADPDLNITNTDYKWSLVYVPYLEANNNITTLINAAGCICTFYDASHALRTRFANGTQDIWVSVTEYFDPLNTTWKESSGMFNFWNAGGYEAGADTGADAGVQGVSFAPGVGANVHPLAVVDAFTAHMNGDMAVNGNTGVVTSATLMSEVGIFEEVPSPVTSVPFPGLNTTASVTNVTQALVQLVANATTSFIQMNTGNTTVTVSVPSTENVYHYNRRTLGVTYIVSFGILLLMNIFGLYCLITNGEPSSNDFAHILIATRNPELDSVAEEMETKSEASGRTRLAFEDGRFGVANRKAVL